MVESPRDLDRRHSAGSNSGSNVHQVPRDDVKILRRIGEGAFGEVSLAHCATFGKVAVKWLKVHTQDAPGRVEAVTLPMGGACEWFCGVCRRCCAGDRSDVMLRSGGNDVALLVGRLVERMSLVLCPAWLVFPAEFCPMPWFLQESPGLHQFAFR